MPIITIINLFLAASIIAILSLGVVLNLKYAQNNIYKYYLVSTFIFWLVVFACVYVKFYVDDLGCIDYNFDLVSVRVMLLGIPCFLSITSLPVTVLNAQLFKFGYWLKVLSSIALVVVLYFGWHYATGNDPFVRYETYDELLQNITSVSLLLRLFLYVVFLIYVVAFLVSMYSIVPLYNRYIEDNVADCNYNVDWIRTFVKFTSAVSVCYFVLVLTNSPYINCLYLIALLFVFGYIIDVSLFHKTIEGVEPLILRWSFKGGWRVVGTKRYEGCQDQSTLRLEQSWDEINHWMKSESPYVNVEFSTQDVMIQFPDLTAYDLTAIFKLRGESFQTFVRNYRINRACEIVHNCKGDISSKQLFGQVGFSHYSSFSRAFTTVLAIAPSEYIKSVKTGRRSTH